MSETSLFAELVKDKNMRELAMKRLLAIKEKKKENKDSEPEESTPVKEGANTESSQALPVDVGQTTYITPSDVNNIPIPCSDSVQPSQPTYPSVPPPSNFMYPPPSAVVVPNSQVPPSLQQVPSSVMPGSSAVMPTHQLQVTVPPPSSYPNPSPSASTPVSSSVMVTGPGQQTNVKITSPRTIITIPDNNMDISPVHENSNDASLSNSAPDVIHIDTELPVVKTSVSEPVIMKPKPVNIEVDLSKPTVTEAAPPVLKPKSLTKLPMPPGIRQSDFESIDSPPSHSPSPEPVVNKRKTPPRKGIRDLPMPPGKCVTVYK
jgi:cyclin-dependent kinase 12/13